MPRSLLARAALAAALGWGVWAGLARAGGSDLYPRMPSHATELPPGHPPIDSSPSKTPLRDYCRHGRPLKCWGSFNRYGCTSGKADLAFLFGSCRTFFGEPCLKGPPPSALPPWAGPVSTYGLYVGPGPGPGQPGHPSHPGNGDCGCR